MCVLLLGVPPDQNFGQLIGNAQPAECRSLHPAHDARGIGLPLAETAEEVAAEPCSAWRVQAVRPWEALGGGHAGVVPGHGGDERRLGQRGPRSRGGREELVTQVVLHSLGVVKRRPGTGILDKVGRCKGCCRVRHEQLHLWLARAVGAASRAAPPRLGRVAHDQLQVARRAHSCSKLISPQNSSAPEGRAHRSRRRARRCRQ
mmetsp:Transcript_74661/g.231662  ORF Transcript_74661/g.231662 Transcript_74661/m.231662 type:complete len:203 (+) Transcript_74661:117-725(+)